MRLFGRYLVLAGMMRVFAACAALVAAALREGAGRGPVAELVSRAAAQEVVPAPGDIVLIENEYFRTPPEDPLHDPYHLSPRALVPPLTQSITLLRLGEDGMVAERDLRLYAADGQLIQHEYSLGTRETVYSVTQNQTETYTLPRPIVFENPIDVEELLERDDLRIAPGERFDGEKLDIIEMRAVVDGEEQVWQYGVRESDGRLVLRRKLAVHEDGPTEVLEETKVLRFVINPPVPDVVFAPPSATVPSNDLDEPVSFTLPQEKQLSEESAAREATFAFFLVDPAVATAHAVYGRQGPPIPWDDLTLDQRHLQYATGISRSLRTIGSTARGTPFFLIQGPDEELTRVLQSTPPLWSRSYATTVQTRDHGAVEAWIGVGDVEAFVIAEMGGTLVVIGTDAEEEALRIMTTLREG